MSNLRGQGAFIHQLPFIAGREWLLEALIPAGHIPHPCPPPMLTYHAPVEQGPVARKWPWQRILGVCSKTPSVYAGTRTANGICQGTNSFCYTANFNQRKPFLWQALFGANLRCSLEFKNKYNRLTSNNLKELQVNFTGERHFAALESVILQVAGPWGFGQVSSP